MKLETKVFSLYKERYGSLDELSKAMEMSVSQLCRVRRGKSIICANFIIGAVNAFPGYRLDDLFYVSPRQEMFPTMAELPDFRDYMKLKYPGIDEDLVTMFEDLITREIRK